eukprot:Plantae.Rhodophyta-Hildenbrandia_rubra.ctg24687.p1 GENE.Plantae.Rhodophyta-Hildenbrandia_rubra.ctg24687~~Plantae.Rhodophyta-Hildenbrandia_rubra.ctg24687.p1  ORF type:complete len:509 (+),score=84.24 Plantae.Rhodophyta-Hildenbrandia_rubra.ctg24687:44-1570(+)
MWYIRAEATPPEGLPKGSVAHSPLFTYWLGGPSGGGRSVGRKNVDIRLSGKSVSRHHARFSLVNNAYDSTEDDDDTARVTGVPPVRPFGVSVVDSSAYGTFVKYGTGRSRRLEKGAEEVLKEGALVAFGAPCAWFRLKWVGMKVWVANGMSEDLRQSVDVAGLHVVRIYRKSVTHVVCDIVSLKDSWVLLAVVNGVKFVTSGWLEALVKMVKSSRETLSATKNETVAKAACAIPDEELHKSNFATEDVSMYAGPTLDAASECITARKTLFSAYIVAFESTEQKIHWKDIIEGCGGRAKAMSRTSANNVICVQAAGSSATSNVEKMIDEATLVKAILLADASDIKKKACAISRGKFEDLGVGHAASVPDESNPKGRAWSKIPVTTKNFNKSIPDHDSAPDGKDQSERETVRDAQPTLEGRNQEDLTAEEEFELRNSMNPYEFVVAEAPERQLQCSERDDGIIDVRPFYKRLVPVVGEIEMEDAPYVEASEERSLPVGASAGRKRRRLKE